MQLAAVRQKEALTALQILGVNNKDNIHFLGYPDGNLNEISASQESPVYSRCTQIDHTFGAEVIDYRTKKQENQLNILDMN